MSANNRAEQIFNQAVEIESASHRDAFLKGACGEDKDLRQRVENLIRAHEAAGGFLNVQSCDEVATVVSANLLTEAPGTVVGRYKLREKIGEGGCGVVYVAEQEEPVRRKVALKVIKLGMDTRNVVARFNAERQALAMMDHPNIAKVLDAGATESGRPYFVMELVRGIRITDYCDQNNLSPRERLDLFIKVCQAIQHAHQKGIIHRDIKPSNILVTLHDGVPVPKVIDFGIAKATEGRLTDLTVYTELHQFIGTPAYMSPEQAEMSGLDIDTRSDIYSLGVLLYELLTGKTPFDAKELIEAGLDEMRRTIREQEPMRPSTRLSTMLEGDLTTTAKHRASDAVKLIHLLRGDQDWIVMKALEKDRTRRYDTANGLAMDIQSHLGNEAVFARPPSAIYRFQKLVRRNKLAFAAVAAVATAVLLGVVASSWQAVRARAAERQALADATRARQAKTVATDRSRVAEQERQRAESEARRAETNALNANRNLYAANMNLAAQALDAGNLGRAIELLEKHLPTNSSSSSFKFQGSTDMRGWEWRYLWDQTRSDELFTLGRHDVSIEGMIYDPNTESLATSDSNGTIKLWDFRSRRWLADLHHSGHEVRLALSSDGKTFASGGSDGRVQLWDKATQKTTLAITNLDQVLTLAFSPDGKLLADRGHERIWLWNVATGSEIVSWDEPMPYGMPAGLAFSPDGRLLAYAKTDGTIVLWNLAERNQVVSLPGHGRSVLTLRLNGCHEVTRWPDRYSLNLCQIKLPSGQDQ